MARSSCPTDAHDRLRTGYGRYRVDKLMAKHGDAKLTDLRTTLAHCEKTRLVTIHDRCKARFEGFTELNFRSHEPPTCPNGGQTP
jgi:hypothetical protein